VDSSVPMSGIRKDWIGHKIAGFRQPKLTVHFRGFPLSSRNAGGYVALSSNAFWCEGTPSRPPGQDEVVLHECIRHQEQNDQRLDQLN